MTVRPDGGEAPSMRQWPLMLLPLVTALSIWHLAAPSLTRWERRQEERQCEQRLIQIYRAFRAYREDYGEYPNTPLRLFPRYLQAPEVRTCPAYRRGRFVVPQGNLVQILGKRTVVTYYFPYMGLRNPHLRVKRRERVPLVACRIHAELLYEDAYRIRPRTAEEFMRRYGVPNLLILRQNGNIDRFNDYDQPRGSIADLEFTPGAWSRRTAGF